MKFTARQTTYDEDVLDCNVPTFDGDEHFLRVVTLVYFQQATDDGIDFYLDDYEDRKANGLLHLHVHSGGVIFDFNDDRLGAQQIEIEVAVDRQLTDFLVNKLFLGDVVTYAPDVGEDLRLKQTEFREMI